MAGHIVLTGMPGSGKSTVGHEVARLLHRPFWDTDDLVRGRTGATPQELVRAQRRPVFEEAERAVCLEIAHRQNGVVATGGATLLSEDRRAVLVPGNLVICLDCPVAVLWQRLAPGVDRPLLADLELSPLEKLEHLYAQRQPLYAAFPTHVDASDGTPQSIAREIIYRWQPFLKRSPPDASPGRTR